MTAAARHRASTQSLPSAGGWPFLITAFVGRMPAAMLQLGYLMVLSQGGRGLAIGGLAVAAVGLGSAIAAPLLGRAVDRFGPLPVLGAATVVSALAQAAFLVAFLADAPTVALLGIAAVVGAANPQVGPVARSHWSHLADRTGDYSLVSRALGYEGAADEISFIVGPVVASSLVAAVGPVPATLTFLALTLLLQGVFLGYLWFARSAWARATRSTTTAAAGGVGIGVLWPMLACLGVGIVFGATQTGLTAMFSERGQAGLTGLVYGAVGVGSGAASILVVRLPERVLIPVRVVAGAVAMLAAGFAFMSLPHVAVSAAVAVLLGLGAGVVLVSGFGWMERIAPRHRIATMMTLLATCITLGVSSGAAVAGRLAAVPSHSFWPIVASGVLALVAAAGMFVSRPRTAA